MTEKLVTKNHPAACLFLKGEKHHEDIEKAKKKYKFQPEIFQSITDPEGKIIRINSFT
jgi:hypothetical protein